MRGIVGKDFNDRDIKQFANGIVSYIHKNQLKPCIVIGKDNRVTGDYILSVVNSVLLKYGIEVNFVGVATTPEVSFLTRKFKFSLGVVITASHNLWEFNGFKCFDSFGNGVDISKYARINFRSKEWGRAVDFSKFKEVYINELKTRLKGNSIKAVFDCANGASIDVVRKVFPKHQILGRDSSGKYINDGCGAVNLDKIKSVCKKCKKVGFAFDGDADRVIAIDANGEEIDGDKILYILATQMLGFGDRIIGTQISSVGLEVSLRRLGVGLIREKVGAKNVVKALKQNGLMLGGEPCGHIFLNSAVSDGVAVAIELINILSRTGLGFDELLSGYKSTYKACKDIYFEDVNNFRIEEIERFIDGVRVVVRRSETESVVRIFVEGDDRVLVGERLKEVERFVLERIMKSDNVKRLWV